MGGPLDVAGAKMCTWQPQEWRPAIDDSDGPDELLLQVESLRASRARMSAAANEQRRDIERRLHDGVQQDLVALAVNLQFAEELAGSDQAALKNRLAEIRQDVRDAIEAVRALARVVYPPLLTDLGLAEALRGAASGAGVPVRIDANSDRYQPDVEATVYFSCFDVLRIIADVKPPVPAAIRVLGDGQSLLFEIAFDSSPLVLDSVRTAMDDRLGALGGTLRIVGEHDGTRVRGTIPLGGE